MRSNPFYALSVSAMLLGCWLLGEALDLEAGRLAGLLALMGVLQLYEGLLLGLGSFLVRSGRAPRDGVTVLALGSLFLMDATLLATECVTASPRVGTIVALVLAVLAAAKLAGAHRAAPDAAPPRLAGWLFAHAAIVLALPVVAAQLAAARRFTPTVLLALWWVGLLLPIAQRALAAAASGSHDAPSRARRAWTWAPATAVLLHLWAVGYIHGTDFSPAFLAPFCLGLAVVSGREQLVRQAALPLLAVLVSLGPTGTLGFTIPNGSLVTPWHVALLGAVAAWAYLAWRDRARWVAVLCVGTAAALLASTSQAFLVDALPDDAYAWGACAVIAAFVLLGAGVRRSLAGGAGSPGSDGRAPWRRLLATPREIAALTLSLGVFVTLLSAANLLATSSGVGLLGTPQEPSPVAALVALAAGLVAFLTALHARGLAVCQADLPGRRLANLALLASVAAGVLAMAPSLTTPHHPARSVVQDTAATRP